ncbi:MAG: hypothetical protein F4Z59_01475, partial [Gemmatimonadales bacterium]|nr:hypothetical protein [Gemmatimonadales bacterium]
MGAPATATLTQTTCSRSSTATPAAWRSLSCDADTPPRVPMSAADRPRVGVIGVGVMGGAMAGHLAAAGFEVCGYDVDAAKVEASAASPVESVAEVAARSDVVLLSLPSVSALDTVAAELAAAEPAGLVAVE